VVINDEGRAMSFVAEDAFDKAKDVGEEGVDKAEELFHHHEDRAAGQARLPCGVPDRRLPVCSAR